MSSSKLRGQDNREISSSANFASGILKTALDGKLARLIDKRVLSPALATREMDGRLVPIVLTTVLDDQRRPVGGVALELRDADGKVVDTTRTSPGGLGVLRFPPRKPRTPRKADEPNRVTVLADGGDVVGTVHIIDISAEPPKSVSIPPSEQAAKAVFLMAEPFGGLQVELPPGDDPLTRFPIDFSEDACNALLGTRTNGLLDPNNLTTREDPLLSPPGGAKTIVGKRLPLIRRLDVVRYAPDNRRYLVRLRQEWVLLTYTLGELAQIQALDPGAVVQSVEQLANQISSVAREAVDTARSTLSQTLQDTLSSLGSVDSVVRTVANATAHAGGSGWGIGIPGLFGYGSADVNADAHLDLSVNTNVNTSLLVNRAVQQASTLVNEAIAKVHALAEGTQRTASDVVNHLAPLVSQVANALHWRVYEVYAVCTNVDAVHPIDEIQLFVDPLTPFTAEEVLAYRPFFEPALLDRTLVRLFDSLLQAAELPPLTEATVEVTCDSDFRLAFFSLSADVTMTLNGVTQTVTVPSGNGVRATLRFNFTTPVTRGGPPLTATFTITPSLLPGTGGSGAVTRVQAWIDRPLSGPGFILDTPPSPCQVPLEAGPAGADVLVKHVNRNLHYYYGVLATAAIGVPSLRQDVTALSMLDPRLWRLPLMGMEGTTALLLEPETNTVDAHTLLDDAGAGTLVQILAPGSYGEMLTGLLQIPLDTLHPLLQEVATFSPFGPFPNLISGSQTSAASGALGSASSAVGGTGLPLP
jgi:hypothetical protein